MTSQKKKAPSPGRESTLFVSALNLRVHPHKTPLVYVDLFEEAYKKKRSVSVLGDMHLQLSGGVHEITKGKPLEGIRGEIAKFTNIDPSKPFYDIETEREAEYSELKGVEQFDRVKPNYTSFQYIFYPETHLFFFETKCGKRTLSPALVEKFFVRLFSLPALVKKFGRVDITVIPKTEKLDEIKALHLKKLEITIMRPNSDTLHEFEAEVLERMNVENVSKLYESRTAQKNMSIQPTSETWNLAAVAVNNGEVKAEGKDDQGQVKKESTKQHPMTESQKYYPKNTLPFIVLENLAGRMTQKVMEFRSRIKQAASKDD
ncbi:DUF4747 family protein [Endozoicomonas sp. YOMI1]|uniref:DUF4747 family protein n=1 Tax=Endozoicomonas sp. YOMI1 TaxID=2828739 RepID=UPI002148B73D|nr:DUF4747 family protein [Endozoicomonas sp. YOMI1]